MSWLTHLLDGLEDLDEAPPEAREVPEGLRQLHLFTGAFGSRDAAEAYCYDTPDDSQPEPFTRDMPGAYIDPDLVEIAHGEEMTDDLTRWFDRESVRAILDEIGENDTVIVVDEGAFGGLPYALNDTPVLRYLGPRLVAGQ